MCIVNNMNIQKINPNVNFKSGSTYKIIKKINTMNVKEVENNLLSCGIKADFHGNKSVCDDFVLAFEILEKLAQKYKLPFDFRPNSIQIYNTKELVSLEDKNILGMHIKEKYKLLKTTPSLQASTIVINEDYNKNHLLNDINSTCRGIAGMYSTGHFLHITLHELMHNINFLQICKKYGYRGENKILRKKYHKIYTPDLGKVIDETYEKLSLRPKEMNFLLKDISCYAYGKNTWTEIFAEFMTKLIIKSTDRNLNPKKNPLDCIPKCCPKMFREKLEATLEV